MGPQISNMHLSGYEVMWTMVLFDLPVVTPEDRRQATKFRTFLLDEGFYMSQYSVYFRVLSGKEALETLQKSIKHHLPPSGKIDIISITDKQYSSIVSFDGRQKVKNHVYGQQLTLF